MIRFLTRKLCYRHDNSNPCPKRRRVPDFAGIDLLRGWLRQHAAPDTRQASEAGDDYPRLADDLPLSFRAGLMLGI
jgi:hypothetical protein